MEYREHAPPPALQPFVQCIWTLRDTAEPGPPQRILPDGSVELVLHLGDAFQRHDPDGRVHRQPWALVVGDVARPMMLASPRVVDLVAVRFRPGMAGGVLGVPAGALAGACHELESLGSPALRGLWNRVGNAAPARRLRVLEAGLLEARRAGRAPAARVQGAIAAIEAAAGRIAMPEVAALAGCSLRELERRMRADAGLPPKCFARLARFRGVIHRLATPVAPAWARLAAQCGYHDQPHLVREFREFAGTTPGEYWRERHPMADLFTQPVEFLQDGPPATRQV